MRLALLASALLLLSPRSFAAPSLAQDDAAAITEPSLPLSDAPPEEAEALNRLASARNWPSRALAVMRLERYDCDASAGRLVSFTNDPSWRVRAYTYACLARRGIVVATASIEAERDPRVLRAILRGRHPVASATLDACIATIEKSGNVFEAMVALEALAALDAPAAEDAAALRERKDELLSRIILRMNRAEGGALSNRLASITSGEDSGRDYRWREWLRKNRAKPGYQQMTLVPARPAGVRLVERNRVASLDSARFISFEQYLAAVSERPMDLAILIDCTASMWREISDAQGSIDDLVEFLGSVTAGIRIGLVGYRDRTDTWETKAWDFTPSLAEARTRLWSLSAEGGGDTPESVHAAMKLALTKFSWLRDSTPPNPQPIRACVIIGDAPPHPGEGTLCVNLAKRGLAAGVRFYGLIARDSEKNLVRETDAKVEAEPEKPTEDDAREAKPDASSEPKDDEKNLDGRSKRGKPIPPPKLPPATMRRQTSYTWFPEIAEAGGGRAEILKEQDSLVAEIAELTIGDRYRDEFADFFAAYRLLCR